jgi:flagellar basal-body rod protein FlgB
MIGDIQSYLGVYKEAMNLRAYRQQVLASNIANADTPYYKARDFDFRAAMAQATGQRVAGEEALPLARTHAGHLPAVESAFPYVPLQYRSEAQSAVDGNTVDMDVERAQIAENALHYQILTRLTTDKLNGLRTAASGNQG